MNVSRMIVWIIASRGWFRNSINHN